LNAIKQISADTRKLSGQEKAAVLLLSVGEDNAAKLFELMDEDEIRELSQTMATLGTVPSATVEKLCVDFASQLSTTGALVGTFESTERLLLKVMDKARVDRMMEEIRGPAGRTMWDKLGNVNEVVHANYLKNEYPQTVAVVMTKIRPEHAARVLANLPDAFAMEVVMRMLRMEAVQKEILEDVENTLRVEFMSNLSRTSRRDSHDIIAEIFNNLDRGTESRLMSALETRNRDTAERVRALMFTFEDLTKLDPTAIQTLLRAVPKEKLPLALKGASDTLRNLFLSNMSERAAKMLRDDIASMGPVRLRDVDEAQMSIVALGKEMAARGELVLQEKKGEDEMVY
jgi:flagellar motor switch protein FliG